MYVPFLLLSFFRKDRVMFCQAVPVFAEGKEWEMNYRLILRATMEDLEDTVLYIAAASFYHLRVNGHFVAMGPARTAMGYARVDEISLSPDHCQEKNEIEIEVAGYACSSLSTVRQASFVCAELRRGGEVLLATGRDGDFSGFCKNSALQRVERYSQQRHFCEVYDFRKECLPISLAPLALELTYLPRVAPYPTFFDRVWVNGPCSQGRFFSDDLPSYTPMRVNETLDATWQSFSTDQLESQAHRWLCEQRRARTLGESEFPMTLSAGEYAIFDLRRVEAGCFLWSAEIFEEADVVLGFSEVGTVDDFFFTGSTVRNVIEWILPRGEVAPESFEPYAARYAILMVRSGNLTVTRFGIRSYAFDCIGFSQRFVRDPELGKVYAAAVRTFAHNAVDLYTDCPSRERAGFLCDSYFSGKTEYFLTGKSMVEDAFLENYRLYRGDGSLPNGALPMCYPSDHIGRWIPQWNLWYLLEVAEYLTERRPDLDRELFRASVYGVIHLMEEYENDDGLLEHLPSWNFVESTRANRWTQDVSYPTNFLYAAALDATGRLFCDARLSQKAVTLRTRTAEASFNGMLFADHAVRGEDGILRNQADYSEAGQYYAILFGNLPLEDDRYATLLAYVKTHFGAISLEQGDFEPADAFIGSALRVLCLMKLGEREILKNDLCEIFGSMAKRSETLWEHHAPSTSLDHGFASFIVLAIDFVEKFEENL